MPNFVWDCRRIDVRHTTQLTHEKGTEDGLPNYAFQNDGTVRVTVCNKCHPRLPGHIMNIEIEGLEDYFEIADTGTLFTELPDGISGTGASAAIREKVFRYCVMDPYNPHNGHAGKTLQAALGYQWDRDAWKPDEADLEAVRDRIQERRAAWEDAYGDEEKGY